MGTFDLEKCMLIIHFYMAHRIIMIVVYTFNIYILFMEKYCLDYDKNVNGK
jgi:hypothetical protein